MTSADSSFIIVGAGVFGVSTAYHLIKKYPTASVTIVDRDSYDADSRVAASWDWNKVMRADYQDPVYCELALEAQDVFTSDPLWKPFFHQSGLYWMCGRDYARNCMANFERLGRKSGITVWPLEEARELFGGLFQASDCTHVEKVLVNETSGWLDSGDCLRAVTRTILQLGVKYVVEEVATLQLDRDGNCVGIQTATKRELRGSHVILCTGAFTSKLLELSAAAAGVDDLRAGPRILAGGVTTAMVRLDDDTYPRFADMPVGFQGYTIKREPFIGSLPPTKDRALKWWGHKIFKNTSEVLPGRFISAPPAEADYAQWRVSDTLKEDVAGVSRAFYGDEASTWQLEKHRICWDSFTTSSDFIISPHSASKGLYLATCGSFHGYKFFPVLGKYVLQMLDGSLSERLAQRWAWDRERPEPAVNWPRLEMRDLMDDLAGT